MAEKVKSEKPQAPAKAAKPSAQDSELRQKIRLSEVNIDGNLPIYRALIKVKGVGDQMARAVAIKFQEEHGIAFDHTIGLLKDEQLSKLEHIIHNPVEHSIPGFMVNQRKESVSGEDKHFVMTGLDLNTRNVIKKLQEMRAYRGLRHSWGLTVRGQRTRSSGRKQGKKARYRMNKK